MAINYIQPQPDILDKFTKGLQSGQMLSQIRQGREAEEAAVRAKQESDALKAQYAIDLQEAFKNPTPTAMAQLTAKYPGQREALKQSWELLNPEQKQNEILQTGQVYNALLGGNIDIAKDILNENITAAENAGKDATKLKNIASYIDKDPTGAAGYAGMVLSSVMDEKDFASTFKTLGEEKRAAELQPGEVKKQTAEIKKYATDQGLTAAQTNKVIMETKKLGAEAAKAVVELEALKASGGVDPDKKFEQEKKLRDEYVKRSGNYTLAQDAYMKIAESAKDNSGAGDIALVTSFMKMLDPGSVVRETEFATAQNTEGLLGRLQNAAQKVETGQFLTEKQRTDFARLAEKYMQAAEKQNATIKEGLGKVIKNYSLNEENIFGATSSPRNIVVEY